MNQKEENIAETGGTTQESSLGEVGEVKTLTERKINVPDRIVLFDGKISKIIGFESCDPLIYLRLCIALNFYSEEGMI